MSKKTAFLTPIQSFFKTESASGIILMITTALALIVANSPLSDWYFNFFKQYLSIEAFGLEINKPLILWINDGLMAVFFLLIGLEIKRELLYGELSDKKAAAMPIIAAFGGAIVPGLIFFFFNRGTDFVDGWAIAIATDIAFAIGILTLLGSKVPVWAKVFLTAVAVVDDLIAVLVIAVFYTSTIQTTALIIAGVSFIALLALNFGNVNRISAYLIIGAIMWVAFLKSGVHATIAGVLLGLTLPARLPSNVNELADTLEQAGNRFKEFVATRTDEHRTSAIHYMDEVISKTEPALYRLEHKLHPWVAFAIIPIFAFANAGLAINGSIISAALSSPLTWGIILGLFLGKQAGIFLSVNLMRKLGLDIFPTHKGTQLILYGLACLSGVGFTMSLFIAGLSFSDATLLEYTKVGIILGSFLSGFVGFLVLKVGISKIPSTENNSITNN